MTPYYTDGAVSLFLGDMREVLPTLGRFDCAVTDPPYGDPAWAASLVHQCQDAGIPAFMKQMGSVWAGEHGADPKGGHPEHWPAGLRVREMPGAVGR